MKIVPFAHQLDLNKPSEGYVRSPGLHMSDIYNSLFKGLDPKRFDKPGPPDALAMEYGTSFEEGLEESIANTMSKRLLGERPGEFATTPAGIIVPVGTPNSIIFSPDQFFHGDDLTRLGEFKSTRMTIAKGIREKKFDKWWCQVMAYGYPLKMRDVILIVLFINGHGKWEDFDVPEVGVLPPGPLLLSWEITFSQKELDNNWSVLMRHARKKGMIV